MRMLIPLLVCLTAVARQTDAVRAKPQDPSQTAIACAFPDSGLDFSLYRMNVTTSAAGGGHQKGKSVDADKEEQFGFGFGLNFNADSHPSSGVLFSSDVNGSTGIYHHSSNLTGGPSGGGKNELLWSAGASMNDHARWHPDGSRYAFTSTMQPSKFNNEGWTAVYLTSLNGPLNGHQPIRLSESATPAAEYSPSFSPCGNWVAVARGSGAPGMTNISVYNAQTRSGPFQVAVNGGWPAWSGNNTLIFHRHVTKHVWDLVSVELTFSTGGKNGGGANEGSPVQGGAETTLVQGGMTPYVAHTSPEEMVFTFIDGLGHRQVGMMNLATGARKQLTQDPTHHWNPVFVPGDSQVIYHKQRCRGITPNLRRRTSGSPDVIPDLAFANGDFPSLSPDASKIAWTGGGNFNRIDVMNSDGSNKRTIYNKTHTWMTSWVDGGRIAASMGQGFQAANDPRVQVMTLNSDGTDVKQLTNSTHQNQGYPCWSPNGTKIVFRTNVGMHNSDWDEAAHPNEFPGPYHLAIIDADGGNRRNLTMPGQLSNRHFHIGDHHPHWGPNGTIVFMSDRGHAQRPTIWTIKEDGTDLTEVFDQGALSVHPSMTSDGSHIVFTTSLAGYTTEQVSWPFVFWPKAEIFTMTINGSDWRRVTHVACENANVWVGAQQLPEIFSLEGGPNSCSYQDSTLPPGVTKTQVSDGRMKKGRGSDMVILAEGNEEEDQEGELDKEKVIGRPFPHGSIALAERMKKMLDTDLDEVAKEATLKCPYFKGRR